MEKIATFGGYDYYKGYSDKGAYYNLVPIGQAAPNGGYYSKEYILRIKQVPDLFN